MKRKISLAFLVWALTAIMAPALFAQGSSEREIQERLIENQKLRDFERYQSLKPRPQAIIAESKKLLLSYGGWVDLSYVEFHDDDNDSDLPDTFDANLTVDTRLWAELTFRPNLEGDYVFEHKIHGRFRNFYVSRFPNDSDIAKDDNDPSAELLYLDLDLKYGRVKIGRQYNVLGQGLAYANVHDGVSVSAEFGKWAFQSFVTKTLPSEENIDFSVPGFDEDSDRYFSGTQVDWQATDSLHTYAYFLAQKDESDPKIQLGLDYDYHSQYWGIGGSYTDAKSYSLWTEYILESGESVVFGSNDRNTIFAQAFLFGGNYRPEILTKPSLTFEYAYGSGDPDRISVTNTEGGNLNGRDTNFLSFGYYPTGLALAPILANIHVMRIGAEIYPFESVRALERLSVGSDFYLFWKARKEGSIYDVDAAIPSREVGRELDMNLYWPVLSDTIFSVRCGIFFPGDAYGAFNKDPELYLSNTLTFSF